MGGSTCSHTPIKHDSFSKGCNVTGARASQELRKIGINWMAV